MKAGATVLGLVIVAAIIWFAVKTQYTQGPTGGQPPAEVINVVGVKNDLLAIAQAERMYLASHGSYTTIDDLQQDGLLTFKGPNHRGYSYSADVDDGQHFKITAAPSDPAKKGWPTLSIDETAEISQE